MRQETPHMSEYIQRIQIIFSDVLLRRVDSTKTDLLETGILDSMALIELLFNLEEQFGLTLDIIDLDLDNLRSIEKIAELVMTRQEQVVNSATR
jgi:D-alanine--poly(phosphoribitol) ligase subunit 2